MQMSMHTRFHYVNTAVWVDGGWFILTKMGPRTWIQSSYSVLKKKLAHFPSSKWIFSGCSDCFILHKTQTTSFTWLNVYLCVCAMSCTGVADQDKSVSEREG